MFLRLAFDKQDKLFKPGGSSLRASPSSRQSSHFVRLPHGKHHGGGGPGSGKVHGRWDASEERDCQGSNPSDYEEEASAQHTPEEEAASTAETDEEDTMHDEGSEWSIV